MPFDPRRRTEAHSPAVEFRDFDDTGLRVTFAHTYSEIAGGDYLHLSISKNDDEDVFGFNFVNNKLGFEHVPKVYHRSDVGESIEIAHVFNYSITENGKKLFVNMKSQDETSSAELEIEMVGGHPSIPGYFDSVHTHSNEDERYPGFVENVLFDVINNMTARCKLNIDGQEFSLSDIKGKWYICSAAKYQVPSTE